MMQFNRKNISIVSPMAIESPFNIDLPALAQNKKNPSKKYNLIYGLLPVYFFSRAIGLLPFSIVCNSTGKVQCARVRAFDFIWFVFSIGLYISMALFIYQAMVIPKDPNESVILIIGDNLLLISGLASAVIFILIDMFNRNRLVGILKNLTVFDDEVGENAQKKFKNVFDQTLFSSWS